MESRSLRVLDEREVGGGWGDEDCLRGALDGTLKKKKNNKKTISQADNHRHLIWL